MALSKEEMAILETDRKPDFSRYHVVFLVARMTGKPATEVFAKALTVEDDINRYLER